MERYNFNIVEKKWQKIWEKEKTFSTKLDKNKKKFYCLEMFPYPSGNIHMGHVRNYTIGDVLARYKMMQNFNVLHPMGWDSFGMPAENAAKQNNLDPKDWTEKNISNMQEILARGGKVILITDTNGDKEIDDKNLKRLVLKNLHEFVQPIIFTLPVQLLSYYVGVLKGTDVDQPRNLAKSVTVE